MPAIKVYGSLGTCQGIYRQLLRRRGAIGLFGLCEVLAGAEAPKGQTIPKLRYGLRRLLPDAKVWVRSRWAIARGTLPGFFVGVLPGAGPTIAIFLSNALAAVGAPMVRAILAWRHDAASALR